VAELLQAGHLSHRTTDNIKGLKVDRVPDWGQQAATRVPDWGQQAATRVPDWGQQAATMLSR